MKWGPKNTMKYDFTKNIFTQFSPCTGPLINKINNVNSWEICTCSANTHNSSLQQQLKNPSLKGRHSTCLSHRPKASAWWSAERSRHWLSATWLYTVGILIGWKVVASDYVFPTRKWLRSSPSHCHESRLLSFPPYRNHYYISGSAQMGSHLFTSRSSSNLGIRMRKKLTYLYRCSYVYRFWFPLVTILKILRGSGGAPNGAKPVKKSICGACKSRFS
jgi:hypothetical protein